MTVTEAPTRHVAGVVAHRVPVVGLHLAEGNPPLALLVRRAVGLLVDADRVRLAGPSEPCDLVHTVGAVDERAVDATGCRRVHTVDRIELRGSRQLVPAWRWTHRERQRAKRCTAWLTHGRTAFRLVVEVVRAPGQHVACLPVLAPLPFTDEALSDGRPGIPRRQATRRRLGVPPGVRLVVGTSRGPALGALGWEGDLLRRGRRDLQVLVLPPGTDPSAGSVTAGASLSALLEAADLVVAPETDLAAVSTGAVALALGVPVVAVTTDSTADLMVPGRDGVVVAPRPEAVADAVIAHVDAATPWGHGCPDPAPRPAAEDLAGALLRVYVEALVRPTINGRAAS